MNALRHRNRELRRRLQAKATKSAKRLLKRRRRKEARFAADVNHVIAKQIVTEAERTGRGIALQELQGIRERVRLRKPQRVRLHAWSFHQLGGFIAGKAARAGVAVIHESPVIAGASFTGIASLLRRVDGGAARHVRGRARPRRQARLAPALEFTDRIHLGFTGCLYLVGP